MNGHKHDHAGRHFFRCVDCLTTFAIVWTDPTRSPRWGAPLTCNACHGTCEHMGQVEAERLKVKTLTTPCDYRCTDALGPWCSCQCGGANHGTKAVIAVVEDVGSAPIAAVWLGNEHRAIEWRDARDKARAAVEARIAAIKGRKAKGEYVPYNDYWLLRSQQAALVKMCASRSHAHRMKMARSLIEGPSGDRT